MIKDRIDQGAYEIRSRQAASPMMLL